ncbi:MAG: TetR/AcrR family transcriptional regulator [Leptospiraceae bacterium]
MSYRLPAMPLEKNRQHLEALAGSRTAGNPAARLLAAARSLFYEQGYALAGINDIISRSNTSKKSFYRYFPSKQKLGEAYLKGQTRDLIRFIDWLDSKSRDYDHFCSLWARSMMRIASRSDYNGCPFANARAQAPEFHDLIQDIHELQILRLEKLISRLRPDLERKKQCHWIAQIASMQYQGAIHYWRLSGDVESFRNMALMLKTLPDLAGSRKGRRVPRV